MSDLLVGEITSQILSCAYEVHGQLGPGLLESTYRRCLLHELGTTRLGVRSEVPIPVQYKGMQLDCGYRADLIVEGKVLIELKTVDRILPIHVAQLMTYLKLSGVRVGLVMNFNSVHLRDGFRRLIV